MTNQGSNNVSVIDTATNTEITSVPVGVNPQDLAVTPDGHHVFVANAFSNSLSIIDTGSNAVTGTVNVSEHPLGIAVTPDGRYAYVTSPYSDNVLAVDTSTNTVVSTVAVKNPELVAITPDGKHAYVSQNTSVSQETSDTVSVIDTSSNMVTDTVAVGNFPTSVAITPTVPFFAFSAQLQLASGKISGFNVDARFILGNGSDGIQPLTDAVTLTVGSYTVTLPAGSFHQVHFGPYSDYAYVGTVNKVLLDMQIVPLGGTGYAFQAAATNVISSRSTISVPITLTIGNDSGNTTVAPTVVH